MNVKDDDNPNGAAQQRPTEETNLITAPAQKPIEEDVKEPEPPQTAQPTGRAATSAPSVDAHSQVNQ